MTLVAVFDPSNTSGIVTTADRAFWSTLPYILIAVGLIAYLKSIGAEVMIAAAFEGREIKMIVMTALMGGLAPFCSCEVIPFIAALLSLGVFGGGVIKLMRDRGYLSDILRPKKLGGCGSGPAFFEGTPIWVFWVASERRAVFKTEFTTNALFLTKWLIMAFVLEALMLSLVPSELIARVLGGDGFLLVVIAAVIGMPAYLNGYVAPPILAGLITQGMGAGPALAFMIAGLISCIPAMVAVWSLVKPQVFAAYIGLGLSGAIIAGRIFVLII